MADRPISQLTEATTVTESDNFVLEQSNSAKRLSGNTLKTFLVRWIDGHGGIKSIEHTGTVGLTDTYTITYAGDETTTTFEVDNGKGITSISDKSTSGLVDSYTVTFNDGTQKVFTVTNGRGITGISKTSTSGLVDTYTISYNNNTTSTFTVTNGAKGNKGDQTYVWIRYSTNQPTKNSDMHTTADNWIGIYTGTSSSAPSSYTSYAWYKYKGEKGDTGDDVTVSLCQTMYAAESYGTGDPPPSSDFGLSIPSVSQGGFLWTKTDITFSTGTVATLYSVARYGMDGGGGTVNSVHGKSADSNHNVDFLSFNADNSELTITNTNYALKDKNALHNVSDIMSSVSPIGVASTSWNTTTKQATVNVSGVTTTSTIFVTAASTMTQAQYEAIIEGQIVCVSQGAGNITLKAFGEVPTIAIPITVVIFKTT